MRLVLTLIRSGKTRSGEEGRRLGTNEEPLLDSERIRIQERRDRGVYPEATLVYVSPQLRCRETSMLIYPHTPMVVTNHLQAFDSGEFTGKTHNEIRQDKRFSAWAESALVMDCPQGESLHRLTARSIQAFRAIVEEMSSKGIESAAIISHNLVIGALMQRYSIPRSAYRSWEAPYGGGYIIEYETGLSTAKLRANI